MTIATLTRLAASPTEAPADHTPLRCVVCQRAFDFAAGETAVVLRHIAYGYDFAHAGACVSAALEWIFVEPGYDRPAFSLDGERERILEAARADGWSAVMPQRPERVLAGDLVHFEPLRAWALIQYRDGSRRVEGIVRDAEWAEPGGAEFPEAAARASIGYASKADQRSSARVARWGARIQARSRGEAVTASVPAAARALRRAA